MSHPRCQSRASKHAVLGAATRAHRHERIDGRAGPLHCAHDIADADTTLSITVSVRGRARSWLLDRPTHNFVMARESRDSARTSGLDVVWSYWEHCFRTNQTNIPCRGAVLPQTLAARHANSEGCLALPCWQSRKGVATVQCRTSPLIKRLAPEPNTGQPNKLHHSIGLDEESSNPDFLIFGSKRKHVSIFGVGDPHQLR